MSSRLLIAFAVFSCAVVIAVAGPQTVQSGGPCPCTVGNPYGIMKPDGSKLVDDSKVLECCDGLNVCYDSRMDKCMDPSEKYYNGGNKMVCNRHYGKPCGNTCLNTRSQICTSVKPVNGAYYIEAPASRTLVRSTAIKVIVIPLFGTLFGLIAFGLSVFTLRAVFSNLGLPHKICLVLCVLMWFLNIFMFYGAGEGWKFAIAILVTICLTVISFGTENKSVQRFCFWLHFALILYLVGPSLAGNQIISMGNGLVDAVSECNGDAGWVGHWNVQNPGPGSDVTSWNPTDTRWGFCASGFLVWQGLVAVFLITLELFLAVMYFVTSQAPLGGSGSLAQPLLQE